MVFSKLNNKAALFFITVIFVVFSCDKVKNPVIPKNVAIGSKYITKSNAAYAGFKKVFLEDYTGHRCPNCPGAAVTIKSSLIPRYGDSLVVLAVHAGDLSAPSGKYKTQDFRTPIGTVWNSNDGFSISSWPTGLINRRDYGSGRRVAASNWVSVVPMGLKDEYIIKLNVTTEYDSIVRALNTFVKATFVKPYSNSTKITVIYYQDGIVGLQDDKGVEVEDYEFEHMLRGDITGLTWGADFTSKAALAGDTMLWSRVGFSLPENTNNGLGKKVEDKHVSVIVFVSDAITREVLQVEKVKIR